MSRRTLPLGALVLAAAAFVSGCTTTVAGRPVPAPAVGSASPGPEAAGDPTGQPVGACTRSGNPAKCVEWKDTKPQTGAELFAVWRQNMTTSAQMLCSALPAAGWEKYLGAGFYRYLESGSTCVLSADDNHFAVWIGLRGNSPLSEYLDIFQRDPKLAPRTTAPTIAGVPAMRLAAKDGGDTDGKGEDSEDLTLAPTGDKDAPGVMQIQLYLRPPRGKPATAPVDRAGLDVRDALVGDVLKSLFPQR